MLRVMGNNTTAVDFLAIQQNPTNVLLLFGVRVSVMFHLMFVHYTFSLVWAAEWPPFGK